MKDDLTLIITVRERRTTLPRVMEYYEDFPCRIMLLDGSLEPWEIAWAYDHVEYFHLPEMPWMEKMAYGLEQVKTPYVIKMCDDDLVFLHAIPVMIDFLKNNPDYETVTGQEIALRDSDFEYETYEYLLEANLEDHFDDPVERMRFYWTYFNTKIHSMTKTKTQLEVYQFMLDNPHIYAVRFFDKIWSLIVASRGKLKVLSILSNMRSRETRVGNIALHGSIREETKSYLSFERDFLNRDLTKLQEFVGGVDIEFIKDIHKNLCDGKKRKEAFAKLLEELPLKAPPIMFRNMAYGFPQERSRSDIYEKSNDAECPPDIYPVYSQESLVAIHEMYSALNAHPIEER